MFLGKRYKDGYNKHKGQSEESEEEWMVKMKKQYNKMKMAITIIICHKIIKLWLFISIIINIQVNIVIQIIFSIIIRILLFNQIIAKIHISLIQIIREMVFNHNLIILSILFSNLALINIENSFENSLNF